ncbi:ankyrin, partial [Wilcoxina mikolae CBS 423.85]
MQAIDFEDYDVALALVTCYPVLVRQKFYDPINHEWNLPVHYAAEIAGRSKDLDSAIEILRLIVEHDPDGLQVLSSTDSRGRTPLHLAVTGQSHRAVEWLIEHGADVNAIDNRGRHPLHYVSAAHIMDLLLSSGACLDARDKDGLSPLHHVCWRDSLDVLNMFIERGA